MNDKGPSFPDFISRQKKKQISHVFATLDLLTTRQSHIQRKT